MAKNKPLDAPADATASGDTAQDVVQSAIQSTPPEALPQGGGRYTRTPAGDLVRVHAEQETQTASDGNDAKEQA